MKTKRERCLEFYRHELESAREAAVKWAEGFKLNPFEALDWGSKAFKAAAEIEVYTEVVKWLESDSADEYVLTNIRQVAIKKCRELHRSSCPVSNLINTFVGVTWADAADRINRWLVK